MRNPYVNCPCGCLASTSHPPPSLNAPPHAGLAGSADQRSSLNCHRPLWLPGSVPKQPNPRATPCRLSSADQPAATHSLSKLCRINTSPGVNDPCVCSVPPTSLTPHRPGEHQTATISLGLLMWDEGLARDSPWGLPPASCSASHPPDYTQPPHSQ